MTEVYKSYDGLIYENKEDCLEHEVCARRAETLTAFTRYVRYRRKKHIEICEEYLHIKRKKLEDFRKEHPLYSKTYARKLYWEVRTNLKRRMRESIGILKALKKDFREKQRLLKRAKTELAKVRELINKNENKI